MDTSLDSDVVASTLESSKAENGEQIATKHGQSKGMRTHWTTESDYQFVLVLAQHTECNERQGLVINHKYIDQMVVKDVAAGLDKNTPVDALVDELAQKYPSKNVEHRSHECINLVTELRRSLPNYSYEQLNHKHLNMWTRTIVPFRQLFDSGLLFRGKRMMHKDCRRFTKAILDFFVHVAANGVVQVDPNMYTKGIGRGCKLLEQWLTAMLTHHGRNMVNFLYACGVKLATSYILSKRTEKRASQDECFLSAKVPSPDQVVVVLKELLRLIVRSEAYIGLTTVTNEPYPTTSPTTKEDVPALGNGVGIRDPTPHQAPYHRPPVAWPPAHDPYRPRGVGAGAHPRDDYRMAPGGAPHYHRQQPPPWAAVDHYGYGGRGYPHYAPHEPPYGPPPGGRFVYIPPEGHRDMRPAMDWREEHRARPAMQAPPRQHPDPSRFASIKPPTLPSRTGIHLSFPVQANPPPRERYHPYRYPGGAWQMDGQLEPPAWAQRDREHSARMHEMHRQHASGAPAAAEHQRHAVDSPRMPSAQRPASLERLVEKHLAAITQHAGTGADADSKAKRADSEQRDQSPDETSTTTCITTMVHSPDAEPASSCADRSAAATALTALTRTQSEQP